MKKLHSAASQEVIAHALRRLATAMLRVPSAEFVAAFQKKYDDAYAKYLANFHEKRKIHRKISRASRRKNRDS